MSINKKIRLCIQNPLPLVYPTLFEEDNTINAVLISEAHVTIRSFLLTLDYNEIIGFGYLKRHEGDLTLGVSNLLPPDVKKNTLLLTQVLLAVQQTINTFVVPTGIYEYYYYTVDVIVVRPEALEILLCRHIYNENNAHLCPDSFILSG